MKVVLFCGGLGMRMRDGVSSGPKPMAMIGDRPLMWHVMRYYAHYGHTEFVLCLGYGASYVKDFFLNYDETRSNDFVLEGGDRQVKLFRTDISDWRITFVDTGLTRRSGSGCAGFAGSSRTSRCSWPTTPTCSPTRRCPT
jgi:glucose-1-phosphate cytidylyltransferase